MTTPIYTPEDGANWDQWYWCPMYSIAVRYAAADYHDGSVTCVHSGPFASPTAATLFGCPVPAEVTL